MIDCLPLSTNNIDTTSSRGLLVQYSRVFLDNDTTTRNHFVVEQTGGMKGGKKGIKKKGKKKMIILEEYFCFIRPKM